MRCFHFSLHVSSLHVRYIHYARHFLFDTKQFIFTKNPFIWIQDIYDIISIYDIVNNINFILKHSAPFISWESMYALCRVRVQYPLINISEQFVQVSVRLSNKYWIWWSWAKFAEIFLFLWIIHALFWLASLNFCEGNLINCINAYIHIWKQLLVFITSKTCSFSYLQKLKRLAFSIIMVDLEL